VTEADFIQISNYGLNTVRIPFGWWIFGIPPYLASGIAHLDRGVALAYQYNISVLLDLHGAPGSQNGYASSGMQCGSCATNCPENFEWDMYESDQNYSIYILTQIAQRYSNYSNIWGIELLNEPSSTMDINIIKNWYLQAYSALHPIVPDWKIVMHDAFRYDAWVGFMNDTSQYPNAMFDTHIYFGFGTEMSIPLSQKVLEPCAQATVIDFFESEELPVIVGEWSLATNDCVQWLNGMNSVPTAPSYGINCSNPIPDAWYIQFAQNQMATWERGNGWLFWNFKTETDDMWSFFDAVENGWLPPNVSAIPAFIAGTSCNESYLEFIE